MMDWRRVFVILLLGSCGGLGQDEFDVQEVSFGESALMDSNDVPASVEAADNLTDEKWSKHAEVIVAHAFVDGSGFLQNERQEVSILIGQPTRMLIGLSNGSAKSIRLKRIEINSMPLLLNDERLPYDVPAQTLDLQVPSGSEVSTPFNLIIPENRAEMLAQVELTLHYSDEASEYADTFFNETVSFRKSQKTEDYWRLSVAVFTLLLFVSLMVVLRLLFQSTSRQPTTAAGTRESKRKSKKNV